MTTQLSERTVMVVGASRGLGHGITSAFVRTGANVVALARTSASLAELTSTHPTVRAEIADAADPAATRRVLDQHEPTVLIIVAGATPVMRALTDHSWETFSVNWDADVKIAFTWLREILRKPLPRGSRVVIVSSGAALNGSPLSGSYAGAKASQRFIAQYAQIEAQRADLGITITTVMPRMTPFGAVGKEGIRAYATQAGLTDDEYTRQLGPLVTPETAGKALVDLAQAEPESSAAGYLLTADGLAAVT